MHVLALDTTTRAGSAAVVENERVLIERIGDDRRPHAERLPGELFALLADAGIAPSALDAYAVASGPGSFTGLRIGIATMLGLAFVQKRPAVGISALSALGQMGALHAEPGAFVGAWIDAHRREVFSALFRVEAADAFDARRLAEIEGAAVGDPLATLERWKARLGGSPATIVGDGAALYADVIEQGAERSFQVDREVPALAGAIGRMAVLLARGGAATAVSGIQPVYVRRPDAEIARDSATLPPAPIPPAVAMRVTSP